MAEQYRPENISAGPATPQAEYTIMNQLADLSNHVSVLDDLANKLGHVAYRIGGTWVDELPKTDASGDKQPKPENTLDILAQINNRLLTVRMQLVKRLEFIGTKIG